MSNSLPQVVLTTATQKYSLPGEVKALHQTTEQKSAKRSDCKSTSKQFDVGHATKSFQFALESDGVDLDAFIDGYSEICKYLEHLGLVFRFTVSDVRDKLHILSNFRSGTSGAEYVSVQRAVDHEVRQSLTRTGSSASRTVLLLQRAMGFLALLLRDVAASPPDAKAGAIAAKAYKETLSPHHEWLVRKAVQLGVHTLPTAGEVLSRMNSESHQQNVLHVQLLVATLEPLQRRLHDILASKELLNLK